MVWFVRFQRLVEAVCPEALLPCEESLLDDWQEARRGMSPCDAYSHLVGKYCAIIRGHPRGCRGSSNDAGRRQGGLPQWCLSAGLQPEDQAAPADDGLSVCSGRTPADPRPYATLWFGDIPEALAGMKPLNKVIYDTKPCGMLTPWIKKVVKKGYRASRPALAGGCEGQGAESTEQGGTSRSPPWLGYAFLEFRDTAEATEALEHYDGMAVTCGWKMRVMWADEQHQGRSRQSSKHGTRCRLPPGKDPPLGEQLFPATLQREALVQAIQRHHLLSGAPVTLSHDMWVIAEVVKAYYRGCPRREVPVAGAPVPAHLLEALRHELERTRWPAVLFREGMQAQHYLTVPYARDDTYTALLDVARDVLEWADPGFRCTKIAVTKDFQGSPHTDVNDVTYQYAVSLGDFVSGGELCIEGERPDELWVVNTHDRIARVDGRFVHWVRGHSGGDRYSLIFFSTDPACATPQVRPFHADFAPRGGGGEKSAGTAEARQ